MKYLKSYKLFESDESDPELLYDTFGITNEQIGDIIRELLDVKTGLQYKVKVRLKGTKVAIFKSIDSFVIFIESENILSSLVFRDMIEQVDNYLSIYGLEVFYVSPISERALGINIFVKRIIDKHEIYNNKLPEISGDESKMKISKSLIRALDTPRYNESKILEEFKYNEDQIKDLFVDLTDDNIEVYVNNKSSFLRKRCTITIGNPDINSQLINLHNKSDTEIRDVLEFAINYMREELHMKLEYVSTFNNELLKKYNFLDEVDNLGKCYQISLSFKPYY